MTTSLVYLNGQWLPRSQARVAVEDRGFVFADGVYDVVRSYRGRLFRVEDHLARLEDSLAAIRIPTTLCAGLLPLMMEAIVRNHLDGEDAFLYVQITRGTAPRKHAFPSPPPPPTVYLSAQPFETSLEPRRKGVKAITLPDERWMRCDIKSIGLLPNVLAQQAALDRGASEALLHRNGVFTEASHTTAAFVRDGRLLTHPLSPAILPGITRIVVQELCAELGIPFIEQAVNVEELSSIQEIALLGTTTEIMPVVEVDGHSIGSGAPGPITRRLQDAFAERIGQAVY